MPAIELLEGFELLEGIQRGGGYQVKRRRRLRIELLEGFELLEGIQLEGFELLELIEGGIAEGIHRAGRATWYAGD